MAADMAGCVPMNSSFCIPGWLCYAPVTSWSHRMWLMIILRPRVDGTLLNRQMKDPGHDTGSIY
jgi:hypothetical protein